MKKKKIDFGFSFGDSIEGLNSHLRLPSEDKLNKSLNWDDDPNDFPRFDQPVSPWRLVPIYIMLSIFLILLVSRAFKLQVIDGANFLSRSEGNHVQVQINHAPRGVIYDRNGKVLVRNKPGYRLAVRKIDLPENWEKEVEKLAPLLNLKTEELVSQIKESKTDSVTLSSDVSNDQVISLKSSKEEFPWLDVELNPKREYLYGPAVGALIGYTGEVSEEDLKDTSSTPYSPGDQIGKAGVEAQFEKELRGANGYSLVKVDSKGKKLGDLFETKPVSGNDITLSIDIDLQNFAYQTLSEIIANKGGEGAALVVQDPNSGEVLALVSAPSYDNNLFTKPLKSEEYARIINDPGHLLLNRAIESAYPPGSTFKMIVSAAGLETGAINRNSKYLDTGFVKLGDVTFNNWLWLESQKTEGEINVIRALARSNDTFFYLLGNTLGEATIAKYAKVFGLGQKTGIELPGEVTGLVPTAEWKQKTFGQVWYPGETINYSIGQGYLLVSPLQLNQHTAAIANGGKLIVPTLIHNSQTQTVTSNIVRPDTLEALREGMYANTFGDGNVSYLFRNFPVKTAGKTGTAESGNAEAKPHAWYTAFAPYENPEIAVTVLVERVGHGSEVSAPVVKKIFEWWLANRKN